MAFLREMIDMCLGGVRVELCKGHVVVLYRIDEALAHVRVDSLADADRLEEVAKSPRVHGVWRPHYLYEGKAMTVSEFEAAVAERPFW